MPPKKPAQNDKKGQGQQLIDDDYSDMPTLPPLNDFIFTSVYAFKYKKNQAQISHHLLKHFAFPPEDPQSAKVKVVQREDIINHAKLKQYITEEESLDMSKLPQERLTELFAKVTAELVLYHEVPMRRLKKEQLLTTSQDSQAQQSTDLELTLFLKDFPQSAAEFKALLAHKQHLHAVFAIEEQFQLEEEEDVLTFQNPDDPSYAQFNEEVKRKEEIKRQHQFLEVERVEVFKSLLEINQIARLSPLESEMRLCTVQKLKFKGPDPPTSDTEADDYSKQREAEMFEELASTFKDEVASLALDLQEYRKLRTTVKAGPLMPYPEEELKKFREEEEKRLLEEKKKQEEERKAQELLLQQQQQQLAQAKGKPGAAAQKQTAAAGANTKSRMDLLAAADGRNESSLSMNEEKRRKEEEERKQKFKVSRDDEEKEWSFHYLQRVLADLKQGQSNIGALMAAMVYQVEQNNKKPQDVAQAKQFILKQEEQENRLETYFEDVFNKLQIEHNVQEATFQHQYAEQLIQPGTATSPYQSLFNENDQTSQISDTYTFLNGDSISKSENVALQNSMIPGINGRIGMPSTALVQQAQRESDVGAILQFSSLPPTQTQRCLVLRAFEQMLKSKQPERDFMFLDRNFIEKFDALTLRQEIAKSMRLKPDVVYKYYERDDALLLALYFKNPPGRLLRRQWTYPVKVFPDFPLWRKYVKHEQLALNQALIDIESSRVGVIKTNTKYCFPSDNSIIKVDKHQVGNKRLGTSVVLKDNLVFGIREKLEAFKSKGGGEEDFMNREAWSNLDRRCEMWLEFENGVKLMVEMTDHAEPHYDDIPLYEPLPEVPVQATPDLHEEPEIAEQPPAVQQEPPPAKGQPAAASGKQSGLNKNESQKSLKPPANQPPSKTQGKASTMLNSDSQKSIIPVQADSRLETEPEPPKEPVKAARKKPEIKTQDNNDPTMGAKLTFTFEQGLVVQILPNGDVSQSIIPNFQQEKQKFGGTLQDTKTASQLETQRVITGSGEIIKYFLDENFTIYYPDGTITQTDKRKGIWYTTNSRGVRRVRKLKDDTVFDEPTRQKISEKIDPETNALTYSREDGVLIIKYADESKLVMMPDGTQIFTRPEIDQGQTMIITQEGFAPVKHVFDPVKARSRTVIGLGGTDSLMGTDTIMERTNTGKVTEVLLPDKTVVQSYLERQELEGYNNFMTNMVHLIRRDDYSIIKVKQDGEVVVISSNERAYLNDIGKQRDFPKNDFDYFFELFGIPSERRSGVYTANLGQGKIWTQDEEGNLFIVYANGDSVEKLSVSFNLDQLVEGFDRKEPDSPRMKDGEFIEEECKFLPPPKSIAHPRLFMIKNNSGVEYFNQDQLKYLFRCREKDQDLIKQRSQIKVDNEDALSHLFLKPTQKFDAQSFLNKDEMPKIPQSVELVNQTVSVPKEPAKKEFLWRNILEYNSLTTDQIQEFNATLERHSNLRKKQRDFRSQMKVEPSSESEQEQTERNRIWMRIAKEKGIDVATTLGDEYKQLKETVLDEQRQKFLGDLENNFFSDGE